LSDLRDRTPRPQQPCRSAQLYRSSTSLSFTFPLPILLYQSGASAIARWGAALPPPPPDSRSEVEHWRPESSIVALGTITLCSRNTFSPRLHPPRGRRMISMFYSNFLFPWQRTGMDLVKLMRLQN
jgi:hypothetical protein